LGIRFLQDILDESGKLTIRDVQQSDGGKYKCTGSQSGLESASVIVHLDVKAVPVFKSIEDGPRNTNATVGKDITIPCNAFAIPEADVTWFRNGEQLDETKLNQKISISTDRKTLTIRKLCKDCDVESDVSVIQCNASNEYGYVLGQGYLSVLDPTKISVRPVDTLLHWPDPVELTCEATTDLATPVSFNWTLNGHPLADGLVNMSVPGKVFISINKTEDMGRRFLGTWQCNAWNGVSSDSATAKLYAMEEELETACIWCWWSWIPLLVFLLLLLILLIFLLVICNRGEEYAVDKRERQGGNDPVKDLTDTGFQDYKRPLMTEQYGTYNGTN
jgi:hypothetical protein